MSEIKALGLGLAAFKYLDLAMLAYKHDDCKVELVPAKQVFLFKCIYAVHQGLKTIVYRHTEHPFKVEHRRGVKREAVECAQDGELTYYIYYSLLYILRCITDEICISLFHL